jgi:hypothetical protein
MRHRFARVLTATALGAALTTAPVTFSTASGAAAPKVCAVAVIGQLSSGQLTLGPVSCGTGGGVIALSGPVVMASHWMGANFSGSRLDVTSTFGCGGWINMPSGWANVVSSTISSCTVDHYDFNGLLGTIEGQSYGNLSYMDNRTNSAYYG